MIEISFGKLLVLALIALIVLGPEKLPHAARTAGALVRRLRGSWDSVRAEVERELQVDEIRRAAREAVAHMDAAQSELDATLQQVRDAARSAAERPAAGLAGGEEKTATAPEPGNTVTGDGEFELSGAAGDTRTGDLFAGTPSPPSATSAAAAAAEPSHGVE